MKKNWCATKKILFKSASRTYKAKLQKSRWSSDLQTWPTRLSWGFFGNKIDSQDHIISMIQSWLFLWHNIFCHVRSRLSFTFIYIYIFKRLKQNDCFIHVSNCNCKLFFHTIPENKTFIQKKHTCNHNQLHKIRKTLSQNACWFISFQLKFFSK